MPRPPVVLVIAGSDSGGGAGIQADLKTAMAHGVHATTVITAVTAQNSLGVQGVWPLPSEAVIAQFRSVMDDIGADAVKVGMLGTAELVECVRELLEPLRGQVPIVIDPVCASKHGDPLLAADALSCLARDILPLATVATPNAPEAELLLGNLRGEMVTIDSSQAQRAAADSLVAAGVQWALVKGGHCSDPADAGQSTDILSDGSSHLTFSAARTETEHTHGTGCTLASAIASGLAQGMEVPAAEIGRAHV